MKNQDIIIRWEDLVAEIESLGLNARELVGTDYKYLQDACEQIDEALNLLKFSRDDNAIDITKCLRNIDTYFELMLRESLVDSFWRVSWPDKNTKKLFTSCATYYGPYRHFEDFANYNVHYYGNLKEEVDQWKIKEYDRMVS